MSKIETKNIEIKGKIPDHTCWWMSSQVVGGINHRIFPGKKDNRKIHSISNFEFHFELANLRKDSLSVRVLFLRFFVLSPLSFSFMTVRPPESGVPAIIPLSHPIIWTLTHCCSSLLLVFVEGLSRRHWKKTIILSFFSFHIFLMVNRKKS